MEPEQENIDFCPVCSSRDLMHFLTCKDNLVSFKDFTIRSCSTCGFKFTSPRPISSLLSKYYESAEYISHTDSKKGFVNRVYQLIKSYSLYKKLRLVYRYSKSNGKLLDYGCGTGSFLEVCKKAGWQAYGIEPGDSARNLATSKVPGNVFKSAEQLNREIEEIKFDVITLWHVLEHIADLNDWFNFISARLNEKGIIVIAVPNNDSHDAKYFKEFWAAYDLPRHLWHFTPKTICDLFLRKGYKCINISPMIFDAFYVSLLSNKILYGKTKLISSFWRGFISNIIALKTARNYSSQIYFFTRK